MKNGEILTVEIIDIGVNGEGVAKVDGAVVFIPFAITGETVKIKLTHCKKDFAFADLIEVLSPSNDRIKPLCIHFGECGGCDMQHIKYEKQLEHKRANLINNLRKIAGITAEVDEVVFDDQWGYRNKLSLPFGERNGKIVVGFFEKNSHSIVPMKDCPLHKRWAADLIECITSWANECKSALSVYDENTGKGFLRHAVARMMDTLSLTIVGNGKTLPSVNALIAKLKAKFDNFEIYFSPNVQNTNVILGSSAKLVYGVPQKQSLGILKAVVSPLSFLQINNAIRDKIYEKVCLEIEKANFRQCDAKKNDAKHDNQKDRSDVQNFDAKCDNHNEQFDSQNFDLNLDNQNDRSDDQNFNANKHNQNDQIDIHNSATNLGNENNQFDVNQISKNPKYNSNSIQIIELYSGVGLLTAELALRLPNAKITAVEIVEDAVKDADKLMLENGLTNRVTNICDDASHAIQSLIKKDISENAVVNSELKKQKSCDSNGNNLSEETNPHSNDISDINKSATINDELKIEKANETIENYLSEEIIAHSNYIYDINKSA
ncbi:MAG: 23S rRNA (uracil(1939)-C(5))-methyltransferase RlmD, partial [Clostridia bacterium]|nr:23S rRNA (uracil(1939)-C(5))-methyltransferase RlmD [Clostridia bacterium]